MKNGMKSKERVMACFNGEYFDRAPVISPTSVATVESMESTGAFFPFVHTDAEKMAALASVGHDVLGFDTVMPYFSVHQESSSLGCEINWGQKDEMPTISSHPLTHPEDFKMPADFLDKKPVKTVIDSIKILKSKYKDDVAIIGKVMGPWTLSYHLHGVDEFLIKTILEPDEVRAFLDVLKEVSITFAQAQFEAGADIITWADHATRDLISSKSYEEFLLPVHKKITGEIQKMGPLILHTCGYTLDRLDLFAEAGFRAFHFDSRNDPEKAVELAGSRILLTGCVNNPEILLNGTVDDVRNDVYRILNAGVRLVSPECAVPCRTPNCNLKAIVDSVEEYYSNPNI